MLWNVPVGCSRRGVIFSSSRISPKSSSETCSCGLSSAASIMASSVFAPTTFSNSCGDTSITRLTWHDLKNASRSSSTADVITVLPARFRGVPNCFSS